MPGSNGSGRDTSTARHHDRIRCLTIYSTGFSPEKLSALRPPTIGLAPNVVGSAGAIHHSAPHTAAASSIRFSYLAAPIALADPVRGRGLRVPGWGIAHSLPCRTCGTIQTCSRNPSRPMGLRSSDSSTTAHSCPSTSIPSRVPRQRRVPPPHGIANTTGRHSSSVMTGTSSGTITSTDLMQTRCSRDGPPKPSPSNPGSNCAPPAGFDLS